MIRKWIIWTAVILIIIGCGIGVLAMTALNWDFKRLDTDNGEWQKWEFETSEIEIISVIGENFPVRAEESEDGKIHVLAYVTEQTDILVEQQDGVLDISAKIKPTFFSFHMFRGLKTMFNGIVIQIPSGYMGNIALENKNNSISVSELQLHGNLSMTNGNGAITVEETSALSLTAVNSNGAIQLEQVNVREEAQTRNSNGAVKIETVQAKTAEFRNVNGRISLEEVTASKSLQAQNNNGSIRIEDIFAPTVSLRNNNGSIKGNIEGRQAEWRIVSNIKNGSSNLNSNADIARPYLLEAENSNGSIRIEFSGR